MIVDNNVDARDYSDTVLKMIRFDPGAALPIAAAGHVRNANVKWSRTPQELPFTFQSSLLYKRCSATNLSLHPPDGRRSLQISREDYGREQEQLHAKVNQLWPTRNLILL
jgi:hypothetical protein